MSEIRRRFLMTLVGATGVLALRPLNAAWQAGARPQPQPRPSPNAPDPNFPPGLNGPQAVGKDQKTIDKAKKEELRNDVTKLYEMVSELKDQVDKTDANSTLSLSVLKKAQQIEKLAKQIKEVAKG